MFRSGLRTLLDRLTRDMDAKADSSFGDLMSVGHEDDTARDEFMTAYVVVREPVTAAHAARLIRQPAPGTPPRS
jgi:hypothetical protein